LVEPTTPALAAPQAARLGNPLVEETTEGIVTMLAPRVFMRGTTAPSTT